MNIVEFVKANPGATIIEVADGLGYGDNAAALNAMIDANRLGQIDLVKQDVWRAFPKGVR